ncbi:MAG: BTAD domain-containing putative transcriptional regulator [Labedaea sp.]
MDDAHPIISGKLDLVRVAMLGPLNLVAEDGSAVDLGGTRLRMLLVRLALEPGQVVPTDQLIDGLWGANPPSDANNALQSLVSRLRRSLRSGNGTVVESHPAGYRLAIGREDVDVYRFERLAARGREELRAERPADAAASLRAALELWRGTPMADVADAPFANTAIARLAELHATAVEDRVEADIRLGRHEEVLGELRTRLAEQPLRERLATLLVQALYLAGRQADALAVYGSTRRALADELGVEPSAELQRVHLSVLRNDPELTPAGAAEADRRGERRGRLPARLTSFVGRQRELREVVARLTEDRLVTLVGPGGAGKTRLSTEVAAAVAGELRGWFVELAGVGEAADVAGAVLTALGLHEIRMLESDVRRPGHPQEPVERLIEALAGQRCVIVLDNCEHLVGSAAELVDTLLAHCPGLRILATSREPLAITGEVVFPVGPLELPVPGAPARDVGATEAVRLFVDRAVAARPGFALDAGNVAAVAEICHRLDGLPLALELAAARLRSMTVEQVAARLDDRFRLLTAGSRTSMPRHRTLRAVVEWSWDLLEKPERILARRLSVFAASASVESATSVCAGEDLPGAEVLYVLASLVEKSLVEAFQGADGPRYRMLETVKAYAAERLAEAGERDQVHAAFDRYFLDLAEYADPYLRGADQVRWLARLSGDQENIISAVRHAADIGDADTAIRLAMATGWFWALAGRQREALALADRVVNLDGPAPDDARAALRLISSLGGPGMPDREFVERARKELAESNAMQRFPMLAMIEPMLALFTGDMDGALEAAERGRNHPDPWARAVAQLGRAFVAENEGHAEEAEREAIGALEEFRVLGDRWGQAMALGQLSERRTLRGDHQGAISAYEESVRLVRELGAIDDLPELLCRLAKQRARAGDLAGAEREIRLGLAGAQERASVESEGLLRCALADVLRRGGALAEAREQADKAARMLTGISRPVGHWNALFESATAALDVAEGRIEPAREALRRGFEAMLDVPDQPMIAILADGAAHLAMRAGDGACAAGLIGVGTALRGAPDLGNPELNELIVTIKATIGEPAYVAAYQAGAGVGRDDAFARLRGVLGSTQDVGPAPVR